MLARIAQRIVIIATFHLVVATVFDQRAQTVHPIANTGQVKRCQALDISGRKREEVTPGHQAASLDGLLNGVSHGHRPAPQTDLMLGFPPTLNISSNIHAPHGPSQPAAACMGVAPNLSTALLGSAPDRRRFCRSLSQQRRGFCLFCDQLSGQ
jgi:hypothetical protein